MAHLLNSSGARLVVASRRFVPQIATVAGELAGSTPSWSSTPGRATSSPAWLASGSSKARSSSATPVPTGISRRRGVGHGLRPVHLGHDRASKGVLIPWGMWDVESPAMALFGSPGSRTR